MMKVIIDATINFDKTERPRLISGLSMIANLCVKALPADMTKPDTIMMYYLCAMTGCIILVDHLHPEGAFHNKSPIRIKTCISKLKDGKTDFLLNSLRFTTIQLKQPKNNIENKKVLAKKKEKFFYFKKKKKKIKEKKNCL